MKRRHVVALMGIGSTLSWGGLHAQGNEPIKAAAKPTRNTASASAAGNPGRLNFGLITPRNAEQTLKNWSPFLDRLSAALKIPVERFTYSGQADMVKAFNEGKLDLAWMGNAPALDIVEAGRGSVYAAMVVQNKTAYRSVLITRSDSPVRTLDDVHRLAPELVFGDGDLKSTSGHIVPRYFAFVKKGVNDPDKFFKEIKRGSHESNALAVADKSVDVATNNTSELENLRSSKPEAARLLRVVWESPDIPESPMVWRTGLSPVLTKKIADFTYAFGAKDTEEKDILWNINKLTGFRKSSNRQLVTIADVEMFNARQQVINDTKLSAQERTSRVEEIIQRGSKLELMLKRSI